MFGFSSNPAPHIILIIGDDGVIFASQGIADLPPPFFAVPDEANIAAILTHIARHPDAPVTLLCDQLAQDFRRETLPRMGFLDRKNLITRRLKQAFPQAGLAAHLKLGHGEILLASAHESGPAFGWLARLKSSMPRLCLLPVECAPMAAALLPGAADGWAMLLSHQRTGGFRQIVTFKGELAFARLTPPLPVEASDRDVAEAVARDIKASLGYLARLGLKDAGQLDVMLLMREDAHEVLRKLMPPVKSLALLSPHKAALRFNLPFVPHEDEVYSDLLYAGYIMRHRARLPLMPPETCQAVRAKQTRAVMQGTLAGTAMAASLFALYQAWGLTTAQFDNRGEAARLEAVQLQIDNESAKIAPNEPIGLLRQAAARKKLFAETQPSPWPLLAQLNSGLGAEARLVKLGWRNDGAKSETIEAEIKLSGAAPDADREKTAARFRQVTENIAKAVPGYNLSVTHYPFPALPGDALSGGGNAASDARDGTTAGIVLKRSGT